MDSSPRSTIFLCKPRTKAKVPISTWSSRSLAGATQRWRCDFLTLLSVISFSSLLLHFHTRSQREYLCAHCCRSTRRSPWTRSSRTWRRANCATWTTCSRSTATRGTTARCHRHVSFPAYLNTEHWLSIYCVRGEGVHCARAWISGTWVECEWNVRADVGEPGRGGPPDGRQGRQRPDRRGRARRRAAHARRGRARQGGRRHRPHRRGRDRLEDPRHRRQRPDRLAAQRSAHSALCVPLTPHSSHIVATNTQ